MLVIVGVVLLISSCYGQIDFSDRSRNFSIELLHYTQLETEGHIVISPFGIWTLMTGVALGATGNSYEQLRRAFILPKSQKKLINGYQKLTSTVLDPAASDVVLTSKNFVFLDNGFTVKPDFRKLINTDFDASVKILNFKDPNSAARIANNYIKSSGAKVSNVLTSDDFAESRMILSNVISFKGLWTSPFNKSETNIEPFYDENKQVIGKVNMMFQRSPLPFSSMSALKAFVAELPYGSDGKYSMLIILPHPNIKITDMYRNFATVSLKDVLNKLQNDIDEFGLEDIDIKLPRFKISTNVILNKPLYNMGVYDIFDPDLASFAKVTDESIFVSAIVHKAEIEVTESGTVASASSVAGFADRITTPKFEANRPFVYFVIEKTTATVIFGGIYSKPSVF